MLGHGATGVFVSLGVNEVFAGAKEFEVGCHEDVPSLGWSEFVGQAVARRGVVSEQAVGVDVPWVDGLMAAGADGVGGEAEEVAAFGFGESGDWAGDIDSHVGR